MWKEFNVKIQKRAENALTKKCFIYSSCKAEQVVVMSNKQSNFPSYSELCHVGVACRGELAEILSLLSFRTRGTTVTEYLYASTSMLWGNCPISVG